MFWLANAEKQITPKHSSLNNNYFTIAHTAVDQDLGGSLG